MQPTKPLEQPGRMLLDTCSCDQGQAEEEHQRTQQDVCRPVAQLTPRSAVARLAVAVTFVTGLKPTAARGPSFARSTTPRFQSRVRMSPVARVQVERLGCGIRPAADTPIGEGAAQRAFVYRGIGVPPKVVFGTARAFRCAFPRIKRGRAPLASLFIHTTGVRVVRPRSCVAPATRSVTCGLRAGLRSRVTHDLGAIRVQFENGVAHGRLPMCCLCSQPHKNDQATPGPYNPSSSGLALHRNALVRNFAAWRSRGCTHAREGTLGTPPPQRCYLNSRRFPQDTEARSGCRADTVQRRGE
eukprot:7385127-Prymnesium_polylepis.2